MRILVVEDDPLERVALRQVIEQEGYQVFVAANGSVALDIMATVHPHVVITDWQVPGIAGEELCHAIERLTPGVSIIVLSSAQEAFSSPVKVSVRLRKPVDVPQLRSILAARTIDAQHTQYPEGL